MKILYATDIHADPSKGAANADLSLLAALRERGHEVEEIWEVGAPRSIRHDNLHLLLEAPVRCEREILGRMRVGRYDVVLVNQPLGWRTARALQIQRSASLFIARSHGWEPRVFSEHRSYAAAGGRSLLRAFASGVLRPILHRHNRLLLRWADGVVVGSREDRKYILANSRFDSDRVLALPPGLPVEFVKLPAGDLTQSRSRRLLYVGQFAPVKAPAVVAAVMAGVLESRSDASASWVCAAADHAKVRALLPDSVRERVMLLDWMPRDRLIEIYDAHGIYLFPSFFEGFGQTFLEAMARGMAVLATRVGGMVEAINDRENGFLFERDRANEMAVTAVALMNGEFDLARLGSEARRTAEDYTWPRSAEMFEGFVTALQKRRMGAA